MAVLPTTIIISLALVLIPVTSFVPGPRHQTFHVHSSRNHRPEHATTSAMPMMSLISSSSAVSESFISTSQSLLLSTIDADIAQLSDNEFAPIFAGGILVMFGGLLSALVVGTIVDQKNLYATIVAESYAQGSDDPEFWKGLSEEEKKKTQELLRKIKENDNRESGETVSATTAAPTPAATLSSTATTVSRETRQPTATVAASPSSSTADKAEKSPELDLFSDY
jgi:hypothetical protein